MSTNDKLDFERGYVLACCNIYHLHREDGVACDVLSELGVSRAEVKRMGLTEYDLAALRKIETARGKRRSPFVDGRTIRRRGRSSDVDAEARS